jgi:hypothetical protein
MRKGLFVAQLHFARAVGVLLSAMRARTLPAEAPGEGLFFNLNRVSDGKLSTAARAIHEPPFFSLWHLRCFTRTVSFGWHHLTSVSRDDLNAVQEVVRRATSARNADRTSPLRAMNAAPA